MNLQAIKHRLSTLLFRIKQKVHFFPWLPVLLMPVVLFAPVWLNGNALFWGTPYLQFIPWRTWAWQILQNGNLPLWNPMVGMGAPLVANFQSALFYPVNWISFLLSLIGGNTFMAWGQTWLVIFHLVWAGVGMAFLTRRLGLNQLAQAVSGLSFELSGYLVARAGFFSINASVSWLPWILLASYNLAACKKKPSIRQVLYLAFCFGMQLLAGHAQTSFYTLLLLIFWTMFWTWRSTGWPGLLRVFLFTFLAILLATCLAAVQLLPTVEYLLQSQRAGSVVYDYAMNYSFFPLRFLTLFAANLFGSPAHGNYLLNADNYWEDAVYIGLLPILLALGAIASVLKRRSKEGSSLLNWKQENSLILFLFLLSIISFLLALGKNTPIFPFLYRYIPAFNMFQAPTRFTLWAEFGLTLLAGIGANKWVRPKGRELYWMNLAITAGVAVMLGSLLALIFLPGLGVTYITSTAIAGFIGMISGFLSKAAPQDVNQKPGTMWKWLVIILICVDLWVAEDGLNPGASTNLYQTSGSFVDLPQLIGNHRIYIDSKSNEELEFQRFFRFNSFLPLEEWTNLRDVSLPDSGMLVGIRSANNFDPIVPARYESWIQSLDNAPPYIRNAMLQLMDVSVNEGLNITDPRNIIFTPIDNAERFHWSSCAVTASSESEALNLLMNRLSQAKTANENPYEPVVIEGNEIQAGTCTIKSEANITLQKETPNQLIFYTQTDMSGWLVLDDTWYPGWIVKVDGRQTAILHADYLFRGVEIPSGAHLVEFIYQPVSFYAGLSISLLALAGIILIYYKGATYADDYR